jgi:predicted porin
MKNSLPALAMLGVLSVGASAQTPSGVTLYGRVDLSFGKAAGSSQRYMHDGSSSRLGLRGVEDLGGGLKAIFNIEHRFEADTGITGNGIAGETAPGPRFWYGRSIVGLQGGFGQVTLGREYTPIFQDVRVKGSPFGYDFVVSRNGIPAILGLSIGATRNDSAVTYKGTFNGIGIAAQIAEKTDSLVQLPNEPLAASLSYSKGAFYGAVGYEMPGAEAVARAKILNLLAIYDFGFLEVAGSFSKGTASTGEDRQGWLLGLTAPLGQGELRAAFGERKRAPRVGAEFKDVSIASVGYFYNLSKRTGLYADAYHNSKAATEKTGYDLGIRHNF